MKNFYKLFLFLICMLFNSNNINASYFKFSKDKNKKTFFGSMKNFFKKEKKSSKERKRKFDFLYSDSESCDSESDNISFDNKRNRLEEDENEFLETISRLRSENGDLRKRLENEQNKNTYLTLKIEDLKEKNHKQEEELVRFKRNLRIKNSLYSLLGIRDIETAVEEVRSKYLCVMKKLHPDKIENFKRKNPNIILNENESKQLSILVNKMKELLLNENNRREYNTYLNTSKKPENINLEFDQFFFDDFSVSTNFKKCFKSVFSNINFKIF